MRGRNPKAVHAGPKPNAGNAGPKPNARNAGSKPDAEMQGGSPMMGRSPMQGQSPKVRPKPNVGPKPNVVNVGPKPDAGPKPESGAETQCVAEAQCSCLFVVDFLQWEKESMKEQNRSRFQCKSVGKRTGLVDRPSVHGSPCHGRRVKAASDLPAKVSTTCMSCGVRGWDERPLVTARLAMER
ncbi:hypothetical protein CDL15_Pgr011683 [Punica granatum]|uniref:Uncharacterized protein n=1 Tax=Punica granatum TaxID=22663 RepID=A0A218WWP0_PUNGR|nr:hypothetical protein CDL15_Pgr011683 [Punica granatum]